jgi:hypothetical protein
MLNVSIAAGSSPRTSALFLRRVLWADAAITGATALLQLLDTNLLIELLLLPRALLVESACVMLASSLFLAWFAGRAAVRPLWVWCAIGANLLWLVGCGELLLNDALKPSLIGQGFIAVQALTTGVLAALEWIGLRKAVLNANW